MQQYYKGFNRKLKLLYSNICYSYSNTIKTMDTFIKNSIVGSPISATDFFIKNEKIELVFNVHDTNITYHIWGSYEIDNGYKVHIKGDYSHAVTNTISLKPEEEYTFDGVGTIVSNVIPELMVHDYPEVCKKVKKDKHTNNGVSLKTI